jgi:pilus assembly protein Flp/PilA
MNMKEFFIDESGLTVVEYVVAAGILAVTLSGFFSSHSETLSSELSAIFE